MPTSRSTGRGGALVGDGFELVIAIEAIIGKTLDDSIEGTLKV